MKFKVFLLLLFVVIYSVGCSHSVPKFNQDQAFVYLEEQCDFGFRYPGSEEIKLLQSYIISKMKNAGAKVEEQDFTTTINDEPVSGKNIIARFFPRMSRRILLAAHYDTRPWADKDPDPKNHAEPVLGANDGASGVAVLLEIASILNQTPPQQYGVDLVFFDVEDSGSYGVDSSWCKGSQFFADQFQGEKPEKAIVVDMIGDKDLAINMEYFSYQNSPALVNEVWEIAKELGFSEFKPKIETVIVDDHLPLIKIGINAIDLIDFDYPVWHTVSDTPDQCSPHSLFVVGQTLLHLIYQEK